jgi:hypothetical protein
MGAGKEAQEGGARRLRARGPLSGIPERAEVRYEGFMDHLRKGRKHEQAETIFTYVSGIGSGCEFLGNQPGLHAVAGSRAGASNHAKNTKRRHDHRSSEQHPEEDVKC